MNKFGFEEVRLFGCSYATLLKECWDKLKEDIFLGKYGADMNCSAFDPEMTAGNLSNLETLLNKGEELQVQIYDNFNKLIFE